MYNSGGTEKESNPHQSCKAENLVALWRRLFNKATLGKLCNFITTGNI